MLDEANELAAELLGRVLLMVLLRGPSPCNVDEKRRAYRRALRRTGTYLDAWGRRPRPPDPTMAAVLRVLTLPRDGGDAVPILMLLLRLLIAGAEAAAAECLDVRC